MLDIAFATVDNSSSPRMSQGRPSRSPYDMPKLDCNGLDLPMMATGTIQIPEIGQAVRVRNRLATVRAVDAYDSRDAQGRLHIVDVEYLDDCRFPEAEQLLWEIEASRSILGT